MKKLTKKSKVIIIALTAIFVCVAAILIINKFLSNDSFKFEYEPLDKVLAAQESVMKNQYDNLVLPEKITAVYPENLYEYYEDRSITKTDNADFEKQYKLINAFTNGKIEKADVYVDEIEGSFRFDGNPEEGKNYIGVVTGDGLCDITSIDAMRTRANFTSHKATVYVKYNENTNVSYDIGGEEYSVADAVAFCESYLEKIDYTQYFDGNIELKPSYVLVEGTKGATDFNENPDGEVMDTNYYFVFFDIYMDGVPLNDAGSTSPDEKFFSSCCFGMMVDKKDNVGRILRTGQIVPDTRTKLDGKFVTLESCLENVSKYLAGGHKYEIKEIGIRYCSIEELGDNDKTARPYWRIVLSEEYGNAITPIETRTAYVDMQKGGIYVYDDGQAKMLDTVDD